MMNRHPSKLGCLRVAVRLPSTRASSIRLINAQIVHHHAAPHAAEGFGIGYALACRSGDAIAKITFPAKSQSGHARPVLNEERRIKRPGHGGHVLDIV